MPDRPNFPIPDELTPDTFCLCLQIPNNEIWKQVFAGLLAEPIYWFNWQRDAAHSGKTVSQYWQTLYDQIDWSDMSCCCDQPPAIFRYNSDGVYQRSTDGGATWTDSPEYDYRNTSTIFPPPSALGIDNTKCQAADSAVVILNEDVIQGLDNGAAVQAILEFIAAVLIFYLSAGTLATVAIGLFSMAAAIFGFGVASTKAAFTSTVLDQLRCSIFNAMNSDDSIDAAGFTALLIDINSNYTGIIKTSLYAIISAAGVVGITNMIRSNRGAPDADCSSCDECITLLVMPPGCGPITHLGDCVYRCESFVEGDHYAIYGWFNNETGVYDVNACGYVTNVTPVSGSTYAQGYIDCNTGTNHFPTLAITFHCTPQFYIQGHEPFVLDITVSDCP